jgi:hypothetical protein
MAINGLMEQLTAIHQLKFSNQLLIGYEIWVLSILALAGILAVHFQRTSKLTNVPILLSSEIRSKRAWEYYHRARELLRKGYEDVRAFPAGRERLCPNQRHRSIVIRCLPWTQMTVCNGFLPNKPLNRKV